MTYITRALLLTVLLLSTAGMLQAQELDEHLSAFAPIVGKTWKGRLSEPGAEVRFR